MYATEYLKTQVCQICLHYFDDVDTVPIKGKCGHFVCIRCMNHGCARCNKPMVFIATPVVHDELDNTENEDGLELSLSDKKNALESDDKKLDLEALFEDGMKKVEDEYQKWEDQKKKMEELAAKFEDDLANGLFSLGMED